MVGYDLVMRNAFVEDDCLRIHVASQSSGENFSRNSIAISLFSPLKLGKARFVSRLPECLTRCHNVLVDRLRIKPGIYLRKRGRGIGTKHLIRSDAKERHPLLKWIDIDMINSRLFSRLVHERNPWHIEIGRAS